MTRIKHLLLPLLCLMAMQTAWADGTITIYYHANNGISPEVTTSQQITDKGCLLGENTFTAPHGYIFDDWCTETTSAGDADSNDEVLETGITFSAGECLVVNNDGASITIGEIDKDSEGSTDGEAVTIDITGNVLHLYALWDPNQEHLRPVFVSSSDTRTTNREYAAKLCDPSGEITKWGMAYSNSNATKPWIIVDCGHAFVFNSYDLVAANDTKSYSGRNWKSWTIEGSNDQSSWNTVDVQTDQTPNTEKFSVTSYNTAGNSYNSSKTAYRYYRITVNANHGGNMIQMSDILFHTAVNYTFNLSTPQDLLDFATIANNGNTHLHAKLMNDIDMLSHPWNAPIGRTLITHYEGTFDGNGHTISNLSGTNTDSSSDKSDGRHGLIGVGGDGMVIRDLTIENANLTGKYQIAVFCARIQGGNETIQNCHFKGNLSLTLSNKEGASMAVIVNSCDQDQSNVQVIDCTMAPTNSTTINLVDFWRWRSIHNFGGRVIVTINETTTSSETLQHAQDEVNVRLAELYGISDHSAGTVPVNTQLNRTIWKDGYYNTICLPFSLTAEQIAAGPLKDYSSLKQFSNATVENDEIVLTFTDATSITAGEPYLISYAAGADIVNPLFENIYVTKKEAVDHSAASPICFQGIFAPVLLEYNNTDYLFLGTNNTLYWPTNDGSFMKGFRAYFKINTTAFNAPARGMRARIANAPQTPTGISTVADTQRVRKLLEQGRIVILIDGVRYDIRGNKL